MRERILDLELKGAIEAFQGIKWKFFDHDEEKKLIRVEVPRGSDESYIVELKYKDDEALGPIVDALLSADFIMQTKHVSPEW
jgi:hypothetical protein